jgi:hypothetical protein
MFLSVNSVEGAPGQFSIVLLTVATPKAIAQARPAVILTPNP